MWPYWIFFGIAAWGVLFPAHLPARQATGMWIAVWAIFTIFMGLRHEVGGDWFSYLPYFERASQLTFFQAMTMPDPGYYALNWFISVIGGDIHGVNLVCAAVVMGGTVVFCRRQPVPWLALLVAIPYMLIVVGMGYTRQGVALGFALLGLVALGSGRLLNFVGWIVLAALFHKSAVLLLPIAALSTSRHRLLTIALVLVATALLYYLLLESSVEGMWTNYVEAQYQSDGGTIRVVMNAVPAIMLLVLGRRLEPDAQTLSLWIWISVFALVCIPLVFYASTAVDRLALYLLPLQMFVFSRVPGLSKSASTRAALVIAVAAYYAVVQFVWLNFAVNASYWVPYHFMPLGA